MVPISSILALPIFTICSVYIIFNCPLADFPPPYSPENTRTAHHSVPPANDYQPRPYNQPLQIILLTNPQTDVPKPEAVRRRRKAATIIGVIEIILSIGLLLLGLSLARSEEPGFSVPQFSICLLGLTTGILSFAAGRRGNRSFFIATLVMAIITCIFSAGGFIMYTIVCAVYNGNRSYYGIYHDGFNRYMTILSAITLVIHLMLMIMAIVQSGYACAQVCTCCRKKRVSSVTNDYQIVYIAQPNQNGPNIIHGAPAYITPTNQNGPNIINGAPVLHPT